LKSLNKQVQENQESNSEWRYNKQAMSANRVFATINANLFGGKLPDPVIGFNNSGRLQQDGAYHWEGDGISLPHHIDLRQDLSELETVVALIHNATHMSMEVYSESKTWYHSKPFRDTMQKFGIKTKPNGDSLGFYKAFSETLEAIGRPDLATELLNPDTTEGLIGDVVVGGDDTPVVDAQSVEVPTLESVVPMPTKQTAPKANKMKKWTCGCTPDNKDGSTTVRAVRVHPDTICGGCGKKFLSQVDVETLELVSI
jgi:hypothetical protein